MAISASSPFKRDCNFLRVTTAQKENTPHSITGMLRLYSSRNQAEHSTQTHVHTLAAMTFITKLPKIMTHICTPSESQAVTVQSSSAQPKCARTSICEAQQRKKWTAYFDTALLYATLKRARCLASVFQLMEACSDCCEIEGTSLSQKRTL